MSINGGAINTEAINGSEEVGLITVTGGSFKSSLTSWLADVSFNVTGGAFASSMGTNFGAAVEGGSFNTSLASIFSNTAYFYATGGAFSSSLSASITSTEFISLDGAGAFKSSMDAAFGADVEGGKFASSLLATLSGYAVFHAEGGAFTSVASITMQDIGVLSVSGGAFESALLYFEVSGGGFMSSLSASITNQLDNAVAYVMNVRTGEQTRYTNYGFLHIITIGGKPYGVRSDGLYLLEGNTDYDAVLPTAINGVAITKAMDNGSYHEKHCPQLYLNSDTQTKVTPIVDGVEKSAYLSSFGGRKTKMGRGLSGRYYQFKVENISAVEGMEILFEERQRRVR